MPDGEFLDGSMHATLFLNGPFSPVMLRPTISPPAFQLCRPVNGRPAFAGLDGVKAAVLKSGCISAPKLETQPTPSSPWAPVRPLLLWGDPAPCKSFTRGNNKLAGHLKDSASFYPILPQIVPCLGDLR